MEILAKLHWFFFLAFIWIASGGLLVCAAIDHWGGQHATTRLVALPFPLLLAALVCWPAVIVFVWRHRRH